eukprot:s411_g24.t1
MLQINVSLPSGWSETFSLPQSSKVGDLQVLAQKSFRHGFLRVVDADQSVVDPTKSLQSAGIKDEDHLTAIAIEAKLAATAAAFALFCCGGDRVVTWGYPAHGGDNPQIQHRLKGVQQVQASQSAFAAIIADGSVVAWGRPYFGGDSSVFDQFSDLLHEIFCEQHRLQVGLFLAHMGGWASILLGSGLAFMLSRGFYLLNLSEVPWAMVFSSSLSSALFNFLIKFGLSRETPVTTSLGTQIGIPLNLLVDVLIVHSHFHWCQAAGVLTMLLSFSVWHHSEAIARKSGDLSAKLLDGAKSSVPAES